LTTEQKTTTTTTTTTTKNTGFDIQNMYILTLFLCILRMKDTKKEHTKILGQKEHILARFYLCVTPVQVMKILKKKSIRV
jgi:hypothetical protein